MKEIISKEEIKNNPYIPDVSFELIPINELVTELNYQRNLSKKHIKEMIASFDIHQVNVVKVSRRDNKNYVFNGQHTIEAIATLSGSRETPVWCMVYDDLIYQSEADIVAKQGENIKPLSPYETFIANIEADSDKHILIKDLVESYQLEIVSCKKLNGICAISTLEKIFDESGYQILDQTLHLIIRTWEGEQGSFNSNMLKAVAKLITTYGDTLRENIFIEKLGNVSIKELTRTAKERRPGSMGYVEAMVIYYNKGRSPYKLEQKQLYEDFTFA